MKALGARTRAGDLLDRPLAALSAAILAVLSFFVRLRGLGHAQIATPDEACHAIVARNLLDDPSLPLLLRRNWFGPEHDAWLHPWHSVHVWLHKPPLPLWQSALSCSALDVDAFALRLPSAVLAAMAVFVIFLIGRELIGGLVGLVGAAAFAVLPAIQMFTSGLLFCDMVDVALLFWSSLGILFVARTMRTGLRRDAVLAGVACGFAYLSKYMLAGIVPGVALAAWILVRFGRAEPERARIRFVHLLWIAGAAAAVAGPWIVACRMRFPDEWAHEQAYALRHLTENIEGWGAPWRRVVFDYSEFLHQAFYAPALAAALVTAPTAFARRRIGPVLLLAWQTGVLAPHLLAASKTPSATLPGVPAALLLFGALFAEAARGGRFALGTLLGALSAAYLLPPEPRRNLWPRQDAISPPCWPEGRWVLVHVGLALCGGLAAVAVDALLRRRTEFGFGRRVRAAWTAAFVFAAVLTFGLGVKALRASGRVAALGDERPPMDAFVKEVSAKLPEDALIIFDRRDLDVALRLMLYSRRDCVSVPDSKLVLARRAVEGVGPKIFRATRDPSRPDMPSAPRRKPDGSDVEDAPRLTEDGSSRPRRAIAAVRPAGGIAFDADSGLSIVEWPLPSPTSAPASRPLSRPGSRPTVRPASRPASRSESGPTSRSSGPNRGGG